MLFNYEGDTEAAPTSCLKRRGPGSRARRAGRAWLFTRVIYFQGVTALRRGENENCIMCRGESSCILPIAPAAVHTNPDRLPAGDPPFHRVSRAVPRRPRGPLAAQPGPHDPGRVSRTRSIPRFLISLDRFLKSEFDIGKFRDIGHLVGVNRFNQAGGAIMEDFDNDGLLDLAVTSFDPTEPMAFYRNKGDGTFEDRTEAAGLTDQLGGLVLRPDRLQQRRPHGPLHPAGRLAPACRCGPACCGTMATARSPTSRKEAGLLDPVNSDLGGLGRLRQRRLARRVRRLRDGSPTACITTGGTARSRRSPPRPACEATTGSRSARVPTWIDFDNDDYPDLFLNNLHGRRPALSQQSRRHLHRCHRVDGHRRARARASRAGPGTTTTTAGSTSSPPATTVRSRTWSRA